MIERTTGCPCRYERFLSEKFSHLSGQSFFPLYIFSFSENLVLYDPCVFCIYNDQMLKHAFDGLSQCFSRGFHAEVVGNNLTDCV